MSIQAFGLENMASKAEIAAALRSELVKRGWAHESADFVATNCPNKDPKLFAHMVRRLLGLKNYKHRGPNKTKKQKIPRHIRWTIWERDNFTCMHCGSRRFLSVDHIIPESKGGTLETNNLQTLCQSCNSKKGPR